MKKRYQEPVPNVELVAYVEQLDALVIVCNEDQILSIDSGDDSSVAATLALLIKTNDLTKPIELIGFL